MLSEEKCVDFIVERFDGFRLINVEYFDNYGEAFEVFQALCDEGHHCLLRRSEVLEDFYPDDWNLGWHSPLLPLDDNSIILSGKNKENEK